MKKWIGLALCAVLVLMTPVMQGAAVYTEGYFQYQVQDGGVVICGYFGRESEVTVPSSIAGYPVSVIGSGAFSGCGQVNKINLPDTIMTIEEGAIGLNQTVVYDSNTDDALERVPQNTPAAAPSGSNSGAQGGSEDKWGGDVYVPSVPTATLQPASPEPSLTPAPSETAQESAGVQETPAAETEAKSTADASAEPRLSALPQAETQNDAQASERVDETAESETITVKPDGMIEADGTQHEPVQDAETDAPQEIVEENPGKLAVKPLEEKKSGSGWIRIAIGAAAGCAVVLAAILMIRRKNGM